MSTRVILKLYLILAVGAISNVGCLSEQSFPLHSQDVVPLDLSSFDGSLTTREWAHAYHDQHQNLLPSSRRLALTSEELTDTEGAPVDVFATMGENPETLHKLICNFRGGLRTAQAVGGQMTIDQEAPAWPGFETVWIPVSHGATLHGRIGFAMNGDQPRQAPCVVLLPGFFGDLGIMRTRDLAAGLLEAGFHVLAIELQGHGQTERYRPDCYYTFGVIETQDLLRVSRWLEDNHDAITATGLIGFCWGGNHGLLASWYDGAGPDHASVGEHIRPFLDPKSDRRHFTAGVIAFSPVLTWENIVARTAKPHAMLEDPYTHFFQNTIRGRMARKGYPEVSGNLRHLIAYEYLHSVFGPTLPIQEGYRFLRLMDHDGLPADDKFDAVRTPTLIVMAVNDPFLNAQDLADLMAETDNPNVAALLLRDGGHTGFAPFDSTYYFSLVVNFFRQTTSGQISAVPHTP